MELRDLRSVVAVAQAGSLSRAAETLHVAQPGLSRQMHELERELGVALLDRHATGVTLTSAGRVFASGAAEVLADLEQAVSRAEAVHEGRRGRVVIGATLAAIASGLTATVVDELRRERPEVELVVKDYDPPYTTDQLRAGGVDLAITWMDALGSGLHAEPLWREVWDRVSVPADHPLAARERVSVPELGDLPLVLPRAALSPRLVETLLALLNAAGLRSPLHVLDGDIRAAHLAIAAGRGWLVMTRSRATAPPPGTATVLLEDCRYEFDAAVLWRSDERRPVVRAVLEKILDVARRHPAQCVSRRPRLPPADVSRSRPRRRPGFLPPGLDVRHFRALLSVAAVQTIGRAAERVGVTQPALSRQLRELEEQLDLPLLERSARGAALTPVGASLAGDCPAVLHALDRLVQETMRARRGMEGRCVIGAVSTVASSAILGRVLVACGARFPRLRIVVEDVPTPHQPAALERGHIDLGLAHAYPALPAASAVVRERVYEDRMQAALLSASHPLAQRKRLEPADLADVPFLFMDRSFHPQFYDRAMADLRAIGLEPLVEATYDGLQVVWSLAAQGKGWAFGFRSHFKRPPAGTVAIPIAGFDVPWGLNLLRRRTEPSSAVRSVIQVMREIARAPVARGDRPVSALRSRRPAGPRRRATGPRAH